MPIARPLPPTTTIVFETCELVRLYLALELLEKRSALNSPLARLYQKINVALAMPPEDADSEHVPRGC
jgi:hypothetical protein